MPAQVPTGCVPHLREQRPHAGLGHGIPQRIIRAAVLQLHRPKRPHLHTSQGLPVAGNAIPCRDIVAGIQSGQHQQGDFGHAQNQSHTAILLRPVKSGANRRTHSRAASLAPRSNSFPKARAPAKRGLQPIPVFGIGSCARFAPQFKNLQLRFSLLSSTCSFPPPSPHTPSCYF